MWLFELFSVLLRFVGARQDAERKQVEASDELLEEQLREAERKRNVHPES